MPPAKGAKYKARDPVDSYLRSYGDRHTYGLVDGDPIDSASELRRELAERVNALSASLYPRLHHKDKPHARSIVRAMGVSQRTIWNIMNGTASARTTRKYLFLLFAHIKGINDHLHDCEREAWALMQMAHDPRLHDRDDNAEESDKRMLGRQRKALHDRRTAIAAGKPPPAPTHFMPERLIQPRERDET